MIVFDASTLVSATFRRNAVPARAVQHAFRTDRLAVSEPVLAELIDVRSRPKLQRFLDPVLRSELLWQLDTLGASFEPTERVTDCRDPKDNKYLELALVAGADRIVSSDDDLLVLYPWRGVRILKPADYVAEAGPAP